jgi:hypothetical protein
VIWGIAELLASARRGAGPSAVVRSEAALIALATRGRTGEAKLQVLALLMADGQINAGAQDTAASTFWRPEATREFFSPAKIEFVRMA